MIHVAGLGLSFDKMVFQQIDFSLEQGQIGCLLGRSGCGKTSLLRCLLGLVAPSDGRIVMDGQVLFDKSQGVNIAPHKRGIGMVFQDYGLFAHLTVAQNIAFGLPKGNAKRVDELLDLIQMQSYAKRYPHELSGGQQQRVALARTIAPSPKFVLLDEPFSNLDVSLKQHLSDEIVSLLKSQNIGAILVTHDQDEAFSMADKVGVMAGGRLCQWDKPMGLYHRPNSTVVAEFIGEGQVLTISQVRQSHAQTLAGAVHCPNLSPTCDRLLLRPSAVGITTKKGDWRISHKKFSEGRYLYTLTKTTHTHQVASLKAFDERDFSIGDEVGVSIGEGWAF